MTKSANSMPKEYKTITIRDLGDINRTKNRLRTTDGLEVDVRDTEAFKHFFSRELIAIPSYILISGTSESGKSTFGKLAVASNIGHRLKVYRTLADLVDDGILPKNPNKPKSSPFDYATWLEENPDLMRLAAQHIVSHYLELARETDVHTAVVETVKHSWIITELRRIRQIRTISLYIDADFDQRVSRQSNKTGGDFAATRESVIEKDSWKLILGTADVKELCDTWVTNDGEYETYEQFVLAFLKLTQKSSRGYSGKARDLSEG